VRIFRAHMGRLNRDLCRRETAHLPGHHRYAENQSVDPTSRSARRSASGDRSLAGGVVGADDDAWVFPSEKLTTPMSKDNCWNRYIKPNLAKAGLTWANFQVMRRTHSTLMGDLGVDGKLVADQCGCQSEHLPAVASGQAGCLWSNSWRRSCSKCE